MYIKSIRIQPPTPFSVCLCLAWLLVAKISFQQVRINVKHLNYEALLTRASDLSNDQWTQGGFRRIMIVNACMTNFSHIFFYWRNEVQLHVVQLTEHSSEQSQTITFTQTPNTVLQRSKLHLNTHSVYNYWHGYAIVYKKWKWNQ